MIKIKREMQKTETNVTEYPETQVAFNSNGCLTVRKYDRDDKDKDEIIIFNQSETREIISLFKQIADLFGKNDNLPF